jgi:deoxycytidine triphosphate deaminase
MLERQPPLFPDNVGVSGVLTDTQIQDAVERNWLISKDTFQPSSLEAASYDVRVGTKGVIGGEGVEIDLRRQAMELGPGAYGGIISYEKLTLPESVCARIGSKRALAYEGVILLTGTIVDPGYEGFLLFGVYNASQRRVIIRYNKKLCNIVFERLAKPPERLAPTDPSLKIGNFPDAFLDRMANMEVLPWMQISERVKQIETITKDIIDLKARYDDVLQPIRDLTENVKSLTNDVGMLTNQAKSIAEDVDNLNKLVGENSKQISQLTLNITSMGGMVQGLQERARGLEDTGKTQAQTLTNLQTSFGLFKVLVYIFWGLLLIGLGAFLPTIIERIWPKH